MKKPFLILMLISVVIISISFAVNADSDTTSSEKKVEDCPEASDLLDTTIYDRDVVVETLKTLIPETYINGDEYGEYYSDWSIITARPLPMTIGDSVNDVYFEIAKNFCGKEVANKSWLIRLNFPKWEGVSDSNMESQIFMAKSKDKGWYLWYRYH